MLQKPLIALRTEVPIPRAAGSILSKLSVCEEITLGFGEQPPEILSCKAERSRKHCCLGVRGLWCRGTAMGRVLSLPLRTALKGPSAAGRFMKVFTVVQAVSSPQGCLSLCHSCSSWKQGHCGMQISKAVFFLRSTIQHF